MSRTYILSMSNLSRAGAVWDDIYFRSPLGSERRCQGWSLVLEREREERGKGCIRVGGKGWGYVWLREVRFKCSDRRVAVLCRSMRQARVTLSPTRRLDDNLINGYIQLVDILNREAQSSKYRVMHLVCDNPGRPQVTRTRMERNM